MPQSHSAVFVHAVFSTKNRFPFLRDPLDLRASHVELERISNSVGCPTVAVGGTEDHVHVLARLGRTISQSDFVKELKRISHLELEKRGGTMAKFEWQSGYGMFSVSLSNLEAVARYIHEQETHHRKVTFQDEFRQLLREHGLEWDERYVWD